jgi:hypothetical protein
LAYELWRATAKAGTSKHDSMRIFLAQGSVIYGTAAVVIVMLFVGMTGAEWVGLVFAFISIAVSVGITTRW